jgi:hypothetical protein
VTDGGHGLRHVLRLWRSHGSTCYGKRAMEREQRAADLGVGIGVDLAALGATEEVVNHIESSLAVVAALGLVEANVVWPLVAHGGLIEVEAVVVGRLRLVVTIMGGTLVTKTGCSHLAIVVIEAGGLMHLWPVAHSILVVLRRSNEDRVVGVRLDMLLQILRALKGLATELALVRLERHVDTDVRGDVVALHGGGATRVPLAGEVQVIGALATNMALADMIVENFGRAKGLLARVPVADEVVSIGGARGVDRSA